ncbi:hypothetical protein GCM10010344_62870 [Streptomyces bluensis]|nr:hypothetical protein GCM10010344_62870 [Streptomyces bluensis]
MRYGSTIRTCRYFGRWELQFTRDRRVPWLTRGLRRYVPAHQDGADVRTERVVGGADSLRAPVADQLVPGHVPVEAESVLLGDVPALGGLDPAPAAVRVGQNGVDGDRPQYGSEGVDRGRVRGVAAADVGGEPLREVVVLRNLGDGRSR